MNRVEKVARLRELQERSRVLVVPNPWNAGSAKILAALGFEALATTSAGLAFSVGRRDGLARVSRDETLANAREIVEAVDVPVSADLEHGFGASPEACGDTIRMACEAGLAGGSIEDATGNPDDPIFPFDLSVERVAEAAAAAKAAGFVLTARAENYLHGREDLEDTIARLQAYERAGADVVYAPGITALEDLAALCRSVGVPVNALAGLKGALHSVDELASAGVRRITVGALLARTALDGFLRAAHEIRDHGTFSFAEHTISFGDVSAYMS